MPVPSPGGSFPRHMATHACGHCLLLELRLDLHGVSEQPTYLPGLQALGSGSPPSKLARPPLGAVSCRLCRGPRSEAGTRGGAGVWAREPERAFLTEPECQAAIQARLADRAICPLQLSETGRSASRGRPDAPPCPAQVTLETWKRGRRAGVSVPRTWSRGHCSSAWGGTSLSWGSRQAPGLGSSAEPEAGHEELELLPRGAPRATLSSVASRDDGHGPCVSALPVPCGQRCRLHVAAWAGDVGGRPGLFTLRDSNLTATRSRGRLSPSGTF